MKFGNKIKSLRTEKQWSIQQLADLSGVSKPAIQQYEDNTITPSNKVLKQIAQALGVGVWHFFAGPVKSIRLVDFRDGHTLIDEETERNIIQEDTKTYCHQYLELIHILKEKVLFENPVDDLIIGSFEDVEKAAKKVRKKWKLGESPIDDITSLLEAKGLLILAIERPTRSQGVYGFIEDEGGNIPVIIVNTFQDKEVTRKRFTILHELAHLLLRFREDITKEVQERMCHYFASAILLPEDAMRTFIGKDRTFISLIELNYLKATYGISVQAMIFRVHNVGLIDETTRRKWLEVYNEWLENKKDFAQYTKSEEKPKRFDSLIARALAEKRISKEKAVELTGIPLDLLEDTYNNKTLEF